MNDYFSFLINVQNNAYENYQRSTVYQDQYLNQLNLTVGMILFIKFDH